MGGAMTSSVSRAWEMVVREIDRAEDHFKQAARIFKKLKKISDTLTDSAEDGYALYETKMAFQHAMLA